MKFIEIESSFAMNTICSTNDYAHVTVWIHQNTDNDMQFDLQLSVL